MGSLLIVVRDGSGYRDGDIMRAHTRADALAARAEVIVGGRGVVTDVDRVRELRTVWDRYALNEGRRPDPEDVLRWWEAALETCDEFNARNIDDLAAYPFTRRECREFLPIMLDREIAPDELARWPGKSTGARVNWRRLHLVDFWSAADGWVPDPQPDSIVLEG